VTIAKKEKQNSSKLWYNTCERNRQHGIICIGDKNLTKVEKNVSLSYNTLAGICARDSATITITNNLVSENFAQGILLIESTYAHIEKNVI